jgi:CdvA-like coiled-coil domain
MQSSEAVGFVGKTVEDIYGRSVGVIVGFTLKTNGDVDSVGVDQGNGAFTEVKSSRLILHEQTLILVPTWKADVMRISGEMGVLRKRVSALQELAKDSKEDGPMAIAQYEQLRSQYETRLAKIQESNEKLLEEMKSRIGELDQQDQSLVKFLVNVNIQFRSGEISEISFGLASDQCRRTKTRNAKEREELITACAMLSLRDEEQKARTIEVQVPVHGATGN